jgi:hypothetical protein
MRRFFIWSIAAVFLLTFALIGIGTFNPNHTEDRNVPGATTGKGKAKLTDD